jgi:predicted RNA binding protein with dsRBD fold (UPF0201 family)
MATISVNRRHDRSAPRSLSDRSHCHRSDLLYRLYDRITFFRVGSTVRRVCRHYFNHIHGQVLVQSVRAQAASVGQVNSVREARIGQLAAKIVF